MSVLTKIFDLFKSPFSHVEASELYVTIVQQARQPDFYLKFQVADTVDGRFDMVALHVYLTLRRLKNDPDQTKEFSQSLFDLMFADMDQNLREMSIGDTGVAKRMIKMAEGFYGRAKAYNQALDMIKDMTKEMEDTEQGKADLEKAVLRNIYRNTPVTDSSVAAMASYIINQSSSLDQQPTDGFLAGKIHFSLPDFEGPDPS